ncbi:hypothetical protein ASJ81_05500 [Methanosarcina spelaei]|uniref:DUF7343 domain-containing protein n=1 Tax=Methanosarcina spelaei TaxID=1036679 RepID=A0A2A2HTY9_9EURY|nr:MarR family transcriptional regulator [Methanosarcina spelaei]PAV12743.1 hypothetical protein ASJ81_05500 [Methanosarcina spelaei]
MNLRFYILCTAALLALGISSPSSGVPFLADSNITATIHGATYAWDTLEPLNDTVISINSNPPQSVLAKDGMYSFELGPGDYVITARYYRNNTVIYLKETTLKIQEEGNYVFDLLLYPVSENSAMKTAEDEISSVNSINSTKKTRTDLFTVSYLPVAFMVLILLGGGYKLSRKQSKMKINRLQAGQVNISGFLANALGKISGSGMKPEFGNRGEAVLAKEAVLESGDSGIGIADNSKIEPADLKRPPLTTDLREILDMIRGHRGRITQKELRSRLEYSEVKVSLLLSELEKRGLIKKFKHGRENIVTLIDEERRGS